MKTFLLNTLFVFIFHSAGYASDDWRPEPDVESTELCPPSSSSGTPAHIMPTSSPKLGCQGTLTFMMKEQGNWIYDSQFPLPGQVVGDCYNKKVFAKAALNSEGSASTSGAPSGTSDPLFVGSPKEWMNSGGFDFNLSPTAVSPDAASPAPTSTSNKENGRALFGN